MGLRIWQTPFKIQEGATAFKKLVNNGPLSRLFLDERYRLSASKGGNDPRFFEYYDQSHFIHALNVAVVSGLLYEQICMDEGATPSENEFCLILASGALHDFNKLIGNGAIYPECFEKHNDEFKRLLGDYLEESWYDTIRHLILATEDGMSGHASRYTSRLTGKRLPIVSGCLAVADTLSAGGKVLSPDDAISYKNQLAKLQNKFLVPEIHVLPFTLGPQIAIMQLTREKTIEWIRENGSMLHETMRYVSWVGEPINGKAFQEITQRVSESTLPLFQDIVRDIKIHPGSGSMNMSWVNDYPPSPENLDLLIEKKNKNLIFWGGDWGARHLAKLREYSDVFKVNTKTDGTPTAQIELPEADGTEFTEKKRIQAKIILVSAMIHGFTGQTATTNPNAKDWDFDSVEPKSRKFIAGILDVIEEEFTEILYDNLLQKAVEEARKHIENTDENPVKAIVDNVLGLSRKILNHSSTGNSCVICGVIATKSLNEQNAVGFKPSGWNPRTPAIQSQKNDAKICDACARDTFRRSFLLRESNLATKSAKDSALHIHIHKGDIAVEGYLGNLMREINPKRIKEIGSDTKLTLKARGKDNEPLVSLSNHISVPYPAPNGIDEQVNMLVQALDLCYDTGHKVHITGLGGIPASPRHQFYWQNAPTWVRELRPHGFGPEGLAAIRVNQISIARRIIKAISSAAYQNKSKKSKNIPYRPFINAIIINPISVYRFPAFAKEETGEQHPTIILEEAFMEKTTKDLIEQAARAYCEFNTREYSAFGKSNHWQWATRTVLRGLIEGGDLASIAVRGKLLQEAQRKNQYVTSEQIDRYVTAIEGIFNIYGESYDSIEKDIIAAVQWTSERLYQAEYSKESRDKEKKEMRK